MPKQTILIVDDEPAIREMLCMALEAAAFSVIQAENAQQAHALIIDRRPHLVLLDWMMPGTSGLELLRRLRRDPLTETTPVIMLTAKAEEGGKVAGLDSGADDYVAKPFSPRELIARIKAVLRRIARDEAHRNRQHEGDDADAHEALPPAEKLRREGKRRRRHQRADRAERNLDAGERGETLRRKPAPHRRNGDMTQQALAEQAKAEKAQNQSYKGINTSNEQSATA